MTYPAETRTGAAGAVVARVEEGSPAARAGLLRGDVAVAVEGLPLRDILDWMWASDGTRVGLTLLRDGEPREAVLARRAGEPWGVGFDGVVFDGVRTCENACGFCFVRQLPPGLRPSLSVRDDDYRLSFLTGNFITLTNLGAADVERILEMRLSPLHVSVHAVDPDLRRRLICPAGEDRALEFLGVLLDGGIDVHAQIVLVRGVNDGAALERTLEWLAARRNVMSVGVVPVGVTRYARTIGGTFAEPAVAREVLDALEPWRQRMRAERGVRWVYAADELYLTAGAGLPAWDDYDGFPQFENGIGMARAFVDEFEAAQPGRSGARVTLVTGELFAPVLRTLAPSLGPHVGVVAVRNRLLGETVSVAGLLAGADVAEAVRNDAGGAGGPYLVPACAVNDDGLFLDDLTLGDVARSAGADVRLVSCDAARLVSAVADIPHVVHGR